MPLSDRPYSQEVHTLVGEIQADDISVEDCGCSKIATLAPPGDDPLFVRIQSWSDEAEHQAFDTLIQPGDRYRVTIERWHA